MFKFLFTHNNYTQSNIWLESLIAKENKKLGDQAAVYSSNLAIQESKATDLQLQYGEKSHAVFAVSEDEQDIQKVKEINSELDTIPLLSPFSLAM